MKPVDKHLGITAGDILQRYAYDSETGLFTHKISVKQVKAGDVAGYKTQRGYIKLEYKGQQIFAHRLAWLVTYGEWPSGPIDHINQDKADNRIDNLRIVNATQNGINIKARSKTSGVLGVYYGVIQGLPRYLAHMRVRKKLIKLGICKTMAEARTLRWVAEIVVNSIDEPSHDHIKMVARTYLNSIGPRPDFVAEEQALLTAKS